MHITSVDLVQQEFLICSHLIAVRQSLISCRFLGDARIESSGWALSLAATLDPFVDGEPNIGSGTAGDQTLLE